MMTRRSFISKSACYTGTVLAAGSLFSSMDFIQELLASETAENKKSILSEEKKYILRNASLAPSGHNTQPWNVRIVSDNEWIIGWDRSRSLPAVDPLNRELLLSIGAFCKALSISAESIGIKAIRKVTAKDSFSNNLVRIKFKSVNRSDTLINELKKRRTVKHGFLPEPVSGGDFSHIVSGTSRPDVHIFNRGSAGAGCIEEAVLESNRIQAWRDDAQRELAAWIRWKDHDALRYRNGLTPAGMEISGIGAWYVKHFYDKEDVMSKSFRNQTVELIKRYLSSYGSWIILTTDDDKPETLINAGGDFLRIGLNGVSRKIALHPMTQPLEENGFAESLQRSLNLKGKIQFILRAGYVTEYPGPVSMRMPVERILI